MNRIAVQKLYTEKRKIERRLDKAVGGMEPREDNAEFTTETIHCEMAERTRAFSAGGIGVVHQMVNNIGLRGAIDDARVRLPCGHANLSLDDSQQGFALPRQLETRPKTSDREERL